MHVAQNGEDENQDTDTSSVIDENPLPQPETLTQPQPLTRAQTFSVRAPRTQDLPPDHAEEETVEAYLERLLGSAPRRNSLPRRPADTPSEDADFQKRRPQICLMTYSNRRKQSAGPRRIATGTLWKPRRRTITALCAIAFC